MATTCPSSKLMVNNCLYNIPSYPCTIRTNSYKCHAVKLSIPASHMDMHLHACECITAFVVGQKKRRHLGVYEYNNCDAKQQTELSLSMLYSYVTSQVIQLF